MPKNPYPKETGTASLVGYARVSTLDQNLAMQETALKRLGCIKIFTDTASGSVATRPGLDDAMNFLREGDTLVVWKLDRLGRSMQHMVALVAELKKRGVKFRSLTEAIDTETAAGRMFLHFIITFAEYERSLIQERTHSGLAAARAAGRVGGRKKVLSNEKVDQAIAMLGSDPPIKFKDVCRTLNATPRTLRRRLAERAAEKESQLEESRPAADVESRPVATSHRNRCRAAKSPRAAAGQHRHV